MPPETPAIPLLQFLAPTSDDVSAPPTVQWEVRSGDWWLLLGQPGAGKSEWLAALAGLRPSPFGSLRHFGSEWGTLDSADSKAARRRLALVFENGGRLLHHLTVLENVALPLRYHDTLDEAAVTAAARELLEQTGTVAHAEATPGQLRPALRQRAALARALALKPELLLLDNPTGGLPSQETLWWRQTLTRLHTPPAGTNTPPLTLVLACDDPRDWWDLATHGALLEPGTLTVLGPCPAWRDSREALCQRLLGNPPSAPPG